MGAICIYLRGDVDVSILIYNVIVKIVMHEGMYEYLFASKCMNKSV